MYDLIKDLTNWLENKVGQFDYREWWNKEQSSCEMGFLMKDGRMMIITIYIEGESK